MKDITKVLIIALIVVLTFILQIYVANNLTFFGIKVNLFLVLTVALAIWVKPNITIPFVFVIGLLSDVMFTYSIGKGLVTYLSIMALIIYTSKLYNKQSIGLVIVVMLISVLATGIIFWLFDGIGQGNFKNVFSVLFMCLKESVLAIPLILLCKKIFKNLSEE